MSLTLLSLLAPAALPAVALQTPSSITRWGAEQVLGTSLDLVLRGAGPDAARRAAWAVLGEIERLEAVFSRWSAASELSTLNARGTAKPSPILFELLTRAEAWRVRTGGAFDSRSAPYPIRLDLQERRVTLAPGQTIDLDAIAKGLIIDQAMAAARAAAPEASGLLLDIGGDIRVWSAPGRGLPWDLAVVDPCAFFDNAPPLQQVQLADGALAVSGQSHRRAVDGTGHVRDPRTGAAAGAPLAAVIAPTAMDADALATAFLVMSAHDALPLAGSLPGVAALMIDSQGQVRSTANWPGRPPAAACQTTRPWPRDFVLTASLDIPRHEAANYERPYVAVWITDAQRRPIRTLLMLGPEARWRESNYIYWRRVERMDLAGVARIARPTRAPGRYEVMWDGRTDAGAMAEPGAYTLNIEAAREHGGHSFVTVPLNIGQAPFQAESEAAQEIGTVRVRYGRRTDRP